MWAWVVVLSSDGVHIDGGICISPFHIVLFGYVYVVDPYVFFFLFTSGDCLVWSTVFGTVRGFCLGLSVLAPWRNIFSRLPERIYAKLMAFGGNRLKLKPKFVCAQIWNAIVVNLVCCYSFC
jgi:1,3-beta-glucan synthase